MSRMLERNRSRQAKIDVKGVASEPLKQVNQNTVTTVASTSVNIKKHYSGSNKVTIETTVTMSKHPTRQVSSPRKEEVVENVDDTRNTSEGEESSSEDKENASSPNANCLLRQDTKSRLKRLGVLYSDDPSRLSSPIHKTEEHFYIEEVKESESKPMVRNDIRSSGRSARLAALADTINHWEDDPRHIPLKKEAQGFSSSQTNHKMVYDYERSGQSHNRPSPTRSVSPQMSSSDDNERPDPSHSRPSPIRNVSPHMVYDYERPGPPHSRPSPTRNVSPQIVYDYERPGPSHNRPSPTRSVSPQKSPVKTSPIKTRFGSPIKMGTTVVKAQEAIPPSIDVDTPLPTMGIKQQLHSPRKMASTPPSGSVLDRAQRYEEATSPSKRARDPTELSLAERRALFERNAGTAVLPKAPFGQAVPAKKLQSKPEQRSTSKQQGSLHNRVAAFQRTAENHEKDHVKEALSERQKELEMLKNRCDRNKGLLTQKPDDYKPSAPPPTPPPLPSPPQNFNYGSRRNSSFYEQEEEEYPEMSEPQDSPKFLKPKEAYPVLKDVKKIKLSPPKPGHLYPNLSDMEVESSEAAELDSSANTSNNNRSTSSDMSDESDLHSLGQDIVKLSRSNLKRNWSASEGSRSEAEGQEIDDFLDEALNTSDQSTPPKRISYSNNAGSVHSRSFEYSQNNQQQEESYKQPLLHTVSFYRKQQNMTLKPPSPTRQVRIDPSEYSTDDSIERMEEELDRELKLVEQKIAVLQQEVIKQQSYISQASQALNLCYSTIEFSGSTEQLEAEKLLLLATQRRQAALHEIQRLRVEQTLRPQSTDNNSLTERGSLTLSQVTLPLKMDVIHRAAKDDQCYYLLCLVHHNEEVYSTDVMCAPRHLHHHNQLTFPNTFSLDNVYSDFKVIIEVYGMTARSKEHIPHDVKYHINTSKKDASKLKLTPRKMKGESRLVAPPVQSPGGPSAVRTSAFSLAGYVIFSLREINRKQFTLNKNNYTSVVEGSMQVKIDTEMRVDVEHRGFLTMFEDVSGFGAWHRRWCLLKGDKLSYWKYPDDERKKIPLDTIELTMCVTREVDVVPRDVCARPNTFLLETSRPARDTDSDSLVMIRHQNTTTIRHLLSADTKEDRIQWCQHVNKSLALLRAWGVSARN
ncbi:anillin-like isoform X3 [Macrosteles quadrilineatus]|uniref:anillin-like isoform X3 n=1 Tax=Macrosteles quadrilineatus TaxID=74068 RepID=UPI0023E0DD10|nr:anillin-like isoform X3 [Macrosteles quadrilineatus]